MFYNIAIDFRVEIFQTIIIDYFPFYLKKKF